MAKLEPITIVGTVMGGATIALTVATVFIAIAVSDIGELRENYGRLDTRAESIEKNIGDISTTLQAMKKVDEGIRTDIKDGFDKLMLRFDNIATRMGHLELDPAVLLSDKMMPFAKDLKPFFYEGHVYAVALTPNADMRLQAAGYPHETLSGFLPAYLMIRDALKKDIFKTIE